MFSRILALSVVSLPIALGQGVITTVAGREFLFPDDGKPAVEAQLGGARHMTFDAQGNLYWAEPNLHQVMRMTPAGIISVVAGNGLPNFAGDGGPARAASLFEPTAVAVDASGNVFIADSFNSRIRRVDRSGIITTVAGTGRGDGPPLDGPARNATVALPFGLAFDRRGNLLLSERNVQRIRSISPSGTISTIAGINEGGFSGDGGPATQARLGPIEGVAADADGNVYLADTNNGRIRRIDASGVITTIIGGGNQPAADGLPVRQVFFNRPSAVTVGGNTIYFTDEYNHRVYRVTQSERS